MLLKPPTPEVTIAPVFSRWSTHRPLLEPWAIPEPSTFFSVASRS